MNKLIYCFLSAGIPISQQHLIWQSVELEDDYCLHDYSIHDGATLKLVLAMRGGPINTRRSKKHTLIMWPSLSKQSNNLCRLTLDQLLVIYMYMQAMTFSCLQFPPLIKTCKLNINGYHGTLIKREKSRCRSKTFFLNLMG